MGVTVRVLLAVTPEPSVAVAVTVTDPPKLLAVTTPVLALIEAPAPDRLHVTVWLSVLAGVKSADIWKIELSVVAELMVIELAKIGVIVMSLDPDVPDPSLAVPLTVTVPIPVAVNNPDAEIVAVPVPLTMLQTTAELLAFAGATVAES